MPTVNERRAETARRRAAMTEYLKEHPKADSVELITHFQVSQATVNNDLRWIRNQAKSVTGQRATKETMQLIQLLVDTTPVISTVGVESWKGAGTILRLNLDDVDWDQLPVDPKHLRKTIRIWRAFLGDLQAKAGLNGTEST